MSKQEYIYANGKIIVANKKKIFSHYEGFEKILSQENLVETIEGKIKSYNEKKQELKEITLLDKILGVVLYGGSITSVAIFLIAKDVILLGAILSLFAGAISAGFIDDYVNARKKLKAIDYALIYLNEKLLEAKNDLEELEKKEKNYTEPNQDIYFRDIPSIDKEVDFINGRTNLYYDCGYNYKKYILWYKLGLLREKLTKKHYTERGLNAIERCMATDAFQEKESVIRKLTIATRKKIRK